MLCAKNYNDRYKPFLVTGIEENLAVIFSETHGRQTDGQTDRNNRITCPLDGGNHRRRSLYASLPLVRQSHLLAYQFLSQRTQILRVETVDLALNWCLLDGFLGFKMHQK